MRQLITLLLLFMALPARAEVFELFVVDIDTPAQPGVIVYQVNGGDLLMAQINARLKQNGVMQEEEGSRYVTPAFKRALSNQAVGLMKAAKYQLSYFPALVIDGRFVVYGSSDLKDYYRLKEDG